MEDTRDALSVFSPETARFFHAHVGTPTAVQTLAWPRIAAGEDVLVSAPTGTGKTLAAFLTFIDQLAQAARAGTLGDETQVIYVSPLKSLAADIRENLRRPLEGIEGAHTIRAQVRTGDTPQSQRTRMVRKPPHILITTPESLYLMLTSRSGQRVLRTARAVIIDELHALIDTKRGAHLMLSLARLERLCGHRIQRVGLSATIEPLTLAAQFLSPAGAAIVAPKMQKQIALAVCGMPRLNAREYRNVWEEIAQAVYARCECAHSVIAFCEARRYAEKLSYYVNQLGGEDFSRVHHGSLSKEQRQETEDALRKGKLRLLCATSSMELGIDVGDIDEVLQIGCPRTVSGTMQRLGRAGHHPGRVSVMQMYPRTQLEAIQCGMTAQAAREGGVEEAKPPRGCLDVLSQHLVSMAATEEYTVDDVMALLARTYTFSQVTREEVKACLAMLAGEEEHRRDVPARPRVLYDPLQERVWGDTYSRMLAVSAGGTIPDKGTYAAKTEAGVKIGELDEEFVYETYIGDRFLLGSFGWRVLRIDKDSVILAPTNGTNGRIPFWHGELKGRALKTSLAFGRMMRALGQAHADGRAQEALARLGLDEMAAEGAADFIARQIAVTGALPDERTIIVERFTDENGSHQLMVHSLFGRRINAPLALLLRHAAQEISGANTGCVDEEDGILLYPYGQEALPERLLFAVDPQRARPLLEAMLLSTPLFGMTFRYNAARALMTGMRRQNSRQPLWLQRLRGAELLDAVRENSAHPLIRETRRECMEDLWDVAGVEKLLRDVRAGLIRVREITVDTPSPLSLPLQWRMEAEEMYAYAPVTEGVRQETQRQIHLATIQPAPQELRRTHTRLRRPEDADGLYALLQTEGDLTAQELSAPELDVPVAWLEALSAAGRAAYIEPGLWIAPKHAADYAKALEAGDAQELCVLTRRLLYYKGPQDARQVAERYALDETQTRAILETLCSRGEAVCEEGLYIHARQYERAQKATIQARRLEAPACPPQRYAALLASQADFSAPPEEQLVRAMEQLCGRAYPAALWESVILPRRVRGYREAMLDRLLSQGEFFWRMTEDGRVYFLRDAQIDYDAPFAEPAQETDAAQTLLLHTLSRRGAAFMRPLARAMEEAGLDASKTQEKLLSLVQKGLVGADHFAPVRQMLAWEQIAKAPLKRRAHLRAQAMEAGRWDRVRPAKAQTLEDALDELLAREKIVCRETFRAAQEEGAAGLAGATWAQALEHMRILEYTGRVRRGYFVKGLSGAQYVKSERYDALLYALGQDSREIVWLHAQDPALAWGRELETAQDEKKQPLRRVSGTAVALCGGCAALWMEQGGKTIRCLSQAWEDDAAFLREAMALLAQAYRAKQLFPATRRLTVKRYPAALAAAMEAAGFRREMLDYVLER